MPSRALNASHTSRLQALRKKHTVLSSQIEEELKRPYITDFYLKQLKKQKLLLKDEIENMREAAG